MSEENEVTIFNERLKKLSESLDDFKATGISEQVLICWLVVNLKISKKKAKQIIDCYEGFYRSVINRGILNGLTK